MSTELNIEFEQRAQPLDIEAALFIIVSEPIEMPPCVVTLVMVRQSLRYRGAFQY